MEEYTAMQYNYIYFHNKNFFLEKLKRYNEHKMHIAIKNENMFFVGLKSHHGGGYWYVGHIEERENDLLITGKIVNNPDDLGNPKEVKYPVLEKIKDALIIVIFFLIFWWIILISYLISFIFRLIKKPEKELTMEEKLERFMISYMCCQKC